MRLLSFRVTGFAHFIEPVALAPLEPVTVVHGANNAGKSTLLRAIDLYFRLLGISEGVTREPVLTFDPDEVDLRDMLEGAFNWDAPEPITFLANWSLTQPDLERYSLPTDQPFGHITTELELRRVGRKYELEVLRWQHKDQDLARLDRARDGALTQFGAQVRRLLADAVPFAYDRPVAPFRLLSFATEGFPIALCNALFDARQSLAPAQRRRWALFSHVLACLEPEIGPGTWDTAFERVSGNATLIFVMGESARPIAHFGGGIQRFVSLAAELVLAREPWLALEEPEWRLAPDLQRRFLALAERVLEAEVGPRQLFITTHSAVVGAAGKPFELAALDGIPVLHAGAYRGTDPVRQGGGASLSGLLGLVEELADIDPEEIVPGASAMPEGAATWAPTAVAA